MATRFLDTAALYGFGENESLLGRVLDKRRHEFVLASKCGIFKNTAGKRQIDGRPEVLKATCEASLRRLNTDVIDLYYLHRWDRRVPIEDSVGALSDLVGAGKIREIGLSEVSAPHPAQSPPRTSGGRRAVRVLAVGRATPRSPCCLRAGS